MAGFLFGAMALIAATLLLLLRPWRKAAVDAASTARSVNVGIYRDQLEELERDLAAGALAPADQRGARAELERRLLDDTASAEIAPTVAAGRTRHTSLLLALAIPLLATGLYAWLGAPQALQEPQGDATRQAPAGDIEQAVAALAQKLEKQPDDAKGWIMLARSYHALGRHAEAEAAFERIGDALYADPALLSTYADVLASRAVGNLEGRPLELVTRALALDPREPMALALAATAAFNRNDPAAAMQYWERLLAVVPPDSDEAKWLVKTLAELRAQGVGAQRGVPPSPGARAADVTAGKAVRGSVSLAAGLAAQVLPTDTVFVFARAIDGSRMPLAVQRARVAELPLQFMLDDSLAVSPQHKLSDAPEVRIEARISRSGNATPAPGDLFGMSNAVRPGDAAPVAVRIDQVRP